MARRSPAPDLARSIYLLWGHHPSAGRSGLTVPAIVAAGIEIADVDGLDAVSMRKVADRLGVGAMSLYGHVPGKDDLTALMVDAVYAELYGDDGNGGGDVTFASRAGDWRAAMRFVAERNWALYQRHPWLLDIRSSRPTLGPHVSRKYEVELRPLDGIGLSDVEMDAALALVLSHVDSTARAHRNFSRTRTESPSASEFMNQGRSETPSHSRASLINSWEVGDHVGPAGPQGAQAAGPVGEVRVVRAGADPAGDPARGGGQLGCGPLHGGARLPGGQAGRSGRAGRLGARPARRVGGLTGAGRAGGGPRRDRAVARHGHRAGRGAAPAPGKSRWD